MSTHESDESISPYQITVRFGNEILQAGFTAVPNLVLDHYGALGITSAEMMFIIHVWQYWWTEKNPYPSLQAIADRMATSRRQVRRYTESLKEKGLLCVNERRQPGLGQVSSEYDFAPLIEQVLGLAVGENTGRTKMTALPRTDLTEGGGTKMTAKEYIGNKNTQNKENSSNFEIRKTSPDNFTTGQTSPDTVVTEPKPARHIPNGVNSLRANGDIENQPNRRLAGSALPPGIVTPGDILAARRGDVSQSRRSRGRPPGSADEREQLQAFLGDFARELHDAAPLSSTITRVLRLFREAGVPRERWGDVLYQARAITQEHSAQITTPAGSGAFPGVKNKTPYFLAVVESLIGLRPPGDAPPENSVAPPSRSRRSG